MADTIVNTPASNSDSGAGWFVAILILLAVIVGGFYVYRHSAARGAAPATNINVTVPTPTGGSSGGAAQ